MLVELWWCFKRLAALHLGKVGKITKLNLFRLLGMDYLNLQPSSETDKIDCQEKSIILAKLCTLILHRNDADKSSKN